MTHSWYGGCFLILFHELERLESDIALANIVVGGHDSLNRYDGKS